VRQQAYYNAVPHGEKLTRAEQIERVNAGIDDNKSDDDSEDSDVLSLDKPNVSIQERQEIPMPELTPGSEYLVAFLHSAGTASSNGMGLTGLSWQELEAWVRCTDMTGIITPRELKTIHMLSRVYAREYYEASKKGATPPYMPRVELEQEEVRELISDKVEDVFASIIAAQKRDG